jgi:hypothetical protein
VPVSRKSSTQQSSAVRTGFVCDGSLITTRAKRVKLIFPAAAGIAAWRSPTARAAYSLLAFLWKVQFFCTHEATV